ncbi:Uncharacterised protein family UPF0102 [Actinobaculum suis]|uniref:UPF0102 protein NCTC10327_01460 n=2 Tax=Actinobaculum suis TaxID=1657 RepID=A0A7Z8Y9Q4_9ACTO|nr:Uncharacterised protein family UPF0102 [Actinobaculum suis]
MCLAYLIFTGERRRCRAALGFGHNGAMTTKSTFIRPGPDLELPELPARPSRQEIGAWGENIARRYLETSAGLEILAQNWCSPHRTGELDLVCRDAQARELIGVEVKTRRGANQVPALLSLTTQKRQRLRALLYEWLAAHPQPHANLRLDFIGVEAGHKTCQALYHLRNI